MATISSALSLISQALDASQGALSIVANNVANANTTGYTREVPSLQENSPVVIDGVSYGTGVTETGPSSVRDNVLEQRLAQQQQLASASGSRLAALNTLQALFTPASGSSTSTAGDIGSDITSFFSSFSSLEANPTNNALRQQVLSSATTLAGDISNAAASLNSQQSALDQEASGVTSQVNALTTAIAQLNKQIQSTAPNGDAGTLADQRQQDIAQLSQLIGINQVTTENNGLSITTTSGQLLVSEGTSGQLTTGTVGGVTAFFLGSTNVTAALASGGGSLGGYLTARDQDIPLTLKSLDQLAYNISIQVNGANNAGTDLSGVEGTGTNAAGVTGTGTTPLYIFTQPAAGVIAGSAANMSVVMTDPSQIAAAGFGSGTGDNSNAVAMANLATQNIVVGQTPSNYYSQFVTQLGSTVSEVQTENTAQSASVTQLQTQVSSLSSVNLNDEASSMQQFERSYQAASEVFTILNTVMSSALNLGVQTAVA
jgi:flagellar hook-associated protein 1 FlgK